MVKKNVFLFGILFICFTGKAFGNLDAPISGYIDYNGCRTGEIHVVAFVGNECHGTEWSGTKLRAPGEYLLWVRADPPETYSICACMDVDGSGSCGNDESEPRGRYPDPLYVDTPSITITDIDISLVDPVPCSTPAPTLSPSGTVALMVVLIGSAIWFIRRRNRTS